MSMDESLSPAALLLRLRQRVPLVQCITNYVAMETVANVLLATGASPAMVHAAEESGEFAAIAGALTVNIGTLSPPWVEGMHAAIAGAQAAGRPWVLDPVACQATRYRAQVAAQLLALRPVLVRGNASEILALAGAPSQGQGVDGRDAVMAAREAAEALARRSGAIVAVTGPEDLVTDGQRSLRIAGGSAWMPQVTALGCALTGLAGAALAVAPQAPLAATAAALVWFAAAGAAAAEAAAGPGSFRMRFIDSLHALDDGMLQAHATVSPL